MDIKEALGARIAERRTMLGLTQDYLAQELGVRVAAISDWERGVFSPSQSKLPRLASVLKTTVADLYVLIQNEYSHPSEKLRLIAAATDRLALLDTTAIEQVIDQLDVTLERLKGR